jgi:hypothetical protein
VLLLAEGKGREKNGKVVGSSRGVVGLLRRFEGVERVERIDGGAGAGMFKGFGEWIKWTLADL